MAESIDDAGFESRIEDIDPADVQPSIQPYTPLQDRQGLFIHTFQCMACSLEFALFSWWRDRHTVVNTACPECHRITQKSHFMSTVSDMPGQAFGQGPEIYHYSPVGPDPKLMADCSLFTGLPEGKIETSSNSSNTPQLGQGTGRVSP